MLGNAEGARSSREDCEVLAPLAFPNTARPILLKHKATLELELRMTTLFCTYLACLYTTTKPIPLNVRAISAKIKLPKNNS